MMLFTDTASRGLLTGFLATSFDERVANYFIQVAIQAGRHLHGEVDCASRRRAR